MTAFNMDYSKAIAAMKRDVALIWASLDQNVQSTNINTNGEFDILSGHMMSIISSRRRLQVSLDIYDRVYGKEREACEANRRRIVDQYVEEEAIYRPVLDNVLQGIGDMKADMWGSCCVEEQPPTIRRARLIP